jgi:hypothetical protein
MRPLRTGGPAPPTVATVATVEFLGVAVHQGQPMKDSIVMPLSEELLCNTRGWVRPV